MTAGRPVRRRERGRDGFSCSKRIALIACGSRRANLPEDIGIRHVKDGSLVSHPPLKASAAKGSFLAGATNLM